MAPDDPSDDDHQPADPDQTVIVDDKGNTLALPPLSARPPRTRREVPPELGRYQVRATLGSGGMGTVYLAYDTQLDRLVALKVPHFDTELEQGLVARFAAEAQAAAGIDHPNLCAVHDFGEIDGIPFLTMTYVAGRPLTELFAGGEPLPQEQAVMIVQQVAAAMGVAHAAGIIHRDLKPANIMLGEHGAPVVMDFGVARRESQARRRLTHQGNALGTPAYMAPEALRGDAGAVGPAADIYSLGVTLYQLLTARLPYNGSPIETVRLILRGERPPPPDELRPNLDPQLVAICGKAMAVRIEDRYPSMASLAEALGAFLRGRSQQFQLSDDESAPGSALSTAEVLSRAGERLFTLGKWDVAHDVISTAADLPGLDGLAAIRQRNRLVHLCKNRDRWPEALEHSEFCVSRLGADAPPELAARVYLNRGSILYDLGRRGEAGVAFDIAERHATDCRTPQRRCCAPPPPTTWACFTTIATSWLAPRRSCSTGAPPSASSRSSAPISRPTSAWCSSPARWWIRRRRRRRREYWARLFLVLSAPGTCRASAMRCPIARCAIWPPDDCRRRAPPSKRRFASAIGSAKSGPSTAPSPTWRWSS